MRRSEIVENVVKGFISAHLFEPFDRKVILEFREMLEQLKFQCNLLEFEQYGGLVEYESEDGNLKQIEFNIGHYNESTKINTYKKKNE